MNHFILLTLPLLLGSPFALGIDITAYKKIDHRGDGEPVIATEGWKDAFRIHLEIGKTTLALPSVSAYRIIALAESQKYLEINAKSEHYSQAKIL